MPHRPDAGNAVAAVERVGRINEEETPFLLVVPFDEEDMGGVECTLNSSLALSSLIVLIDSELIRYSDNL